MLCHVAHQVVEMIEHQCCPSRSSCIQRQIPGRIIHRCEAGACPSRKTHSAATRSVLTHIQQQSCHVRTSCGCAYLSWSDSARRLLGFAAAPSAPTLDADDDAPSLASWFSINSNRLFMSNICADIWYNLVMTLCRVESASFAGSWHFRPRGKAFFVPQFEQVFSVGMAKIRGRVLIDFKCVDCSRIIIKCACI